MIKTNYSKYLWLPQFGTVINSELKKDFVSFKRKLKKKDFEYLYKIPNNDEILSNLSDCSQLVFEITQKCSLACKYCVYSGKYPKNRTHKDISMDFDIAKQSLDILFKLITSNLRKSKKKTITFGFYGGEATLEFDLIKKIYNLINIEKKSNRTLDAFIFDYRITTNGTLLNKEKISFFIKNNFYLDISIDGPKSEHDQFRVFKNNSGSWQKIMNGIEKIWSHDKVYCSNKVGFMCTLHPAHDGSKIDSFFLSNKHLFEDRVKFNLIDFENIEGKYKDILAKKFIKSKLYEKMVFDDLKSKLNTKYFSNKTKFTGACFPGGNRIFVTSRGDFKICEKMDDHFPFIGNAFTGFNFDVIRDIIVEYNREIVRNKCWECDCWFLCSICWSNAIKDNKIVFQCNRQLDSTNKMITKYIESLEKEREPRKRNVESISDFISILN